MTTLGICVPTYKRPEFLRRCVNSAVASAENRPIRIFIADDSVSDINVQLLNELTLAYPFVQVHRNPNNLGIDANIQQVVDFCDCDYAWLIGEDDEFLPGAVAAMHDYLQGVKAPFVFSAYQYVSEDHAQVLGLVQSAKQDELIPMEDFVKNWLWSIGFIGSVVVSRAAWNETASTPYLGTYFTHVGRIVDMLSRVDSVAMRNQPAVANRAQGEDTFTWKKDSFGVFLGFERMCEIAASRNSTLALILATASTYYRERFAYFSLKTTFRLRSEGAFDWRQFRIHVLPLKALESWRKLWLFWLAIMPQFALKPFALAYVYLRARSERQKSVA